MFLSLTDDEHITILLSFLKELNTKLETNNPIKAVVVPIERCI